MNLIIPMPWRRPLLIVALIVAMVGFILFYPRISSNKQGADQLTYSTSQKITSRESARVYIGKYDAYRKDVDLKTRTDIERMLYNYAYIIKGNDLYTGVVKNNTYKASRLPDGELNIKMLVDVAPINVTYAVSVAKNKNTNHQQAFLVACAPINEQTNSDSKCKDEQGR